MPELHRAALAARKASPSFPLLMDLGRGEESPSAVLPLPPAGPRAATLWRKVCDTEDSADRAQAPLILLRPLPPLGPSAEGSDFRTRIEHRTAPVRVRERNPSAFWLRSSC